MRARCDALLKVPSVTHHGHLNIYLGFFYFLLVQLLVAKTPGRERGFLIRSHGRTYFRNSSNANGIGDVFDDEVLKRSCSTRRRHRLAGSWLLGGWD